jgi:hypothetical protein
MFALKDISFKRLLLSATILVMHVITGHAQAVYPAQVNVNLIPPYSLYLDDYATGMRERISVTLFNRDLQNPNMTMKLSLTIKAHGFTLKTNSYAPIPAIIVRAERTLPPFAAGDSQLFQSTESYSKRHGQYRMAAGTQTSGRTDTVLFRSI